MGPLIDVYLEHLNEEHLNEFVGITILAIIAIYRKYLSKAAKACRSEEPEEKERCMIKYQIEGRKEQLKKIKEISKECKKAQNPNECERKLYKQAQSINQKIEKLIAKYKKASEKKKTKVMKKAAQSAASADQYEL